MKIMLILQSLRSFLGLQSKRQLRTFLVLWGIVAVVFGLSFVRHPWIDAIFYGLALAMFVGIFIGIAFLYRMATRD